MLTPDKRHHPLILCCIVLIISIFLLIGNVHAHECGKTYDRDACFPHWLDVDHDGLDARQQALRDKSIIPVIIKKHRVVSGEWVDPYTGNDIHNPRKLDIDHVVPLHWAWLHGASTWTEKQRTQFANDQDNLLPVSASANREKGDKGPGKWVPKNINYRFIYVAKFWHVCREYHLRGCQ